MTKKKILLTVANFVMIVVVGVVVGVYLVMDKEIEDCLRYTLMDNAKISYVSKSKIYPAYAYVYKKPLEILIRKDLPLEVQEFLLEYGAYYIIDWQRSGREIKKDYNWVREESKAILFGALKHPFGFLLTAVMSLQPYRLKFYIERFRKVR